MISKCTAKKYMWLTIGCISVGLAFIGALLPLMPTTVFLLIATYSFARSSKRLHDWLLNHKQFGPLINNWQKHRAIENKTKIKAVAVMAATFILSLVLGASALILIIQLAVLGTVALFIITRPDMPKV